MRAYHRELSTASQQQAIIRPVVPLHCYLVPGAWRGSRLEHSSLVIIDRGIHCEAHSEVLARLLRQLVREAICSVRDVDKIHFDGL